MRTHCGEPGNRPEVLYGKKLLIRKWEVFLSLSLGLVPTPWGSLGAGLHLHGDGTCSLPPTRLPRRAATFVSAFYWLVLSLKMFSGRPQAPGISARRVGYLPAWCAEVPVHTRSSPSLESQSSVFLGGRQSLPVPSVQNFAVGEEGNDLKCL